jgi:hypothetical protein
MIEGSGSGSVPCANGSGWPKNIRIRSATLPTVYLFQRSISAKQADVPEVGRVSQLEDETLLLPLYCVAGQRDIIYQYLGVFRTC